MPEERSNETLVQQHMRLRDLAGRIRDAGSREGVAELLPDLRGCLETHFAEEEAAGGVYEMIRESAPEKTHDVERLTEEHRTLLQDVQSLINAAGDVDVVQEALDLCSTLARHEAAENGLVLDVLNTDIGGRGVACQ